MIVYPETREAWHEMRRRGLITVTTADQREAWGIGDDDCPRWPDFDDEGGFAEGPAGRPDAPHAAGG